MKNIQKKTIQREPKAPKKFTKAEFEALYPTNDACLDEIFKIRYANIKICPSCEAAADFKRVNHKSKVKGSQKKSYQCSHCGHQIYPLAGTVFEKTTTPLKDWFYAIYLFTTTRNGVAAKELERQLGVCYKTALRMAHQIKILMGKRAQPLLSGIVELDETYIGMLSKNMHEKDRKKLKGTGGKDKIKVFGMLQRDTGEIIAEVVENTEKQTLYSIIAEKIEPNSTLVTDRARYYIGLGKLEFQHEMVDHSKGEYARGDYHTNTIEGFWSQLKRMIKGTHIKVSKQHMQKYVNECATRYILRNEQATMFDTILKQVA
jgi:transposase-like protein